MLGLRRWEERLGEEGKVTKGGFSAETAEAVVEREEVALAWRVLVKARVRHFSDREWLWALRRMHEGHEDSGVCAAFSEPLPS